MPGFNIICTPLAHTSGIQRVARPPAPVSHSTRHRQTMLPVQEGYMTTYEAICRTVAALESSVHACNYHRNQQQQQQQQQQKGQQNLGPQPQEQQQQQQQQGSTIHANAPSVDALAQAKEHEASLLARLLAPLQLMAAYQRARHDHGGLITAMIMVPPSRASPRVRLGEARGAIWRMGLTLGGGEGRQNMWESRLAIEVDVGERSLGMLQYGGTCMQTDAVFEETRKQMQKGAAQAAMQALQSAAQPIKPS
eukprot:1159321-Pelagomonas_calceolata.AAC.9